MAAARILEEALSLEPDQRARIAHDLIESLDGRGRDAQARKVEAIRAALVEGEQSGIAEDSSLEGILSAEGAALTDTVTSSSIKTKGRHVSFCNRAAFSAAPKTKAFEAQ